MIRLITIIILIIGTTVINAQNNPKQYPNLKAVLIVGYQEDNTSSAIKNMDAIAVMFMKYGIKVSKFYNKKAKWEDIKVVAKDADFFVYSGHGTNLGKDRRPGGLVLTEGVSTDKMLKELSFTKNPLILFQSVCYGAGSSAGDEKDIGIKEAEKRVTDYATPFFEMGASVYFANNTVGACAEFVDNFMQGKSVEMCYGISTDTATFNNKNVTYSSKTVIKIEIDKEFKNDSTKKIGICSSYHDVMATCISYVNGKKTVKEVPSIKSYDVAYIAKPGFTLKDMVKVKR